MYRSNSLHATSQLYSENSILSLSGAGGGRNLKVKRSKDKLYITQLFGVSLFFFLKKAIKTASEEGLNFRCNRLLLGKQ